MKIAELQMCLHWYTSLLVLCVIRVQEISSCSFGNDLNQLTSSTTTGFILNTANPSQCPGKATRWNMCYYSSGNSNAAYLTVYRPSGTHYSLVSGSSSSYSVSPIMSGYSCSHFSIPQSQQFVVQQGDVIAACVQPSGSGRVGIVATASGSLRAQLYTGSSPITYINECAVNNGGCNQTCVDTDVGYNCSCFSGFQLATDMKNCTPIENAVYDDNGAELNAYDVAKAVYEPVKDNEKTEGKNSMPAENIYGNDDEDPYCLPPTEEEELYGVLEQHKTLRIPRHEIETKSALGHGQFGGVHKGKWKSPKGECEVAIKVLDPTKSHHDEDKVTFLQEAAIMAQFKHPNVILLYGIVSEGGPLMLVIELAHNKDLRTHLMTMRPDPGQMILSHVRQSLLTYSQQVALGMQYLSSKSFVHRDLAARNVLVTKACMCKIADFGLSRNLDEEHYYFSHGGMVPVKWTAPEAVCYKKYSTASDVWSFGCVLYEIWSLGFKPFETISNAEVVEKINAGYRLPPPPGCPLLIYETMIHCWQVP
eukprot:Em0008g460a